MEEKTSIIGGSKMREDREGFEPKQRERLADHVVFIGNKPFNRL